MMSTMQIAVTTFDSTLSSLAENVALDEALLLAAEAGESSEVLRFWEWPTYGVVLGAGGSVAIDVREEACSADGVPLQRRSSGGGTVVLGRGCLLYSLVLSFERDRALADVSASYRWILGRIRSALAPAIGAELAGISDLVGGTMKFSGNAQQRKSRHVLHHGTFLYDFDLTRIGRYLQVPERMPDYRLGRSHDGFVRNLPVEVGDLKRLLTAAFEAVPGNLPTVALARVPMLVAEKYGCGDWVRRR